MSNIALSSVSQFIGGVTFLDLVTKCNDQGILLKENHDQTLFLLFSNMDINSRDFCQLPLDLQNVHLECNGIIFEKSSYNIVCHCSKKIQNISVLDKFILQKNTKMEYCEDGTIIRMYYYNGVWNYATTRCFDANESFWISPKSYQDLFLELFKIDDIPKLETNKTLIFILLHVENRLIINHLQNKLIFLESIDNDNNYICRYNNISWADDNPFEENLDYNKIQFVNTKSLPLQLPELESFVDKFKRGIILYDNNNNKYLYDFTFFTEMKSIRGNNNKIHYKILELIINDKNDELLKLKAWYPEYDFLFTMVMYSLQKMIKNIHSLYILSHVKHACIVDNTHKFYKTLLHLHSIYKKSNNTIIITRDVVKNTIYSLNISLIAHLLHWHETY
jgi:hypothetical protein